MEDVITIAATLNAKPFEKGAKTLKAAVNSLSKTAKTMGTSLKRIVPMIIGVGSAFGIISKAVNSFMQQNQKLSNQMSAVWTALGNLLGPIIEKVISWVTTAVSYLLSFLKLLGVTGKTASQLSKAAKGAAGDLQKTVAGFDELNKLQDNSGTGQGSLEDKDPTDWMKKIADLLKGGMFEEAGRELARKLNEMVAKIPWSELGQKLSYGLLSALRFLYGALDEFDFKQIGAGIRAFFENIEWEEIADAIFNLLKAAWKGAIGLLWGFLAGDSEDKPPLIASLERLGESFDTLYQRIKDFVAMAWESDLKPVLEWTTDVGLPWLVDRLSDGIDFLAKLIEEHGPLILGILETVGVFVATLGLEAKVMKIIKAVSKLWAVIAANPIVLLIAAIAALVYAIARYGDEIQEALQKLDDFLQNIFTKDWTEVFGPVLGNVLNGFFKTVKDVWDGIKLIFEGIIDFIRGVFTGDWERAWLGVREIFSGIFSTLDSLLKAPLNGVISLINGAIGGINSLIGKVNGGLGQVFGFSIGSIGEIPYLARGGILKKGEVGLLEGDGAEAVVPLDQNAKWINKVAEDMLDRLKQGNFAAGRIGGNLAALNDIANTVAYRMPAVASGSVLPYSVASQTGRDDSPVGYDPELLDAIRELLELVGIIREDIETLEFVGHIDDIRALWRRIKKEMRRDQISEGS